MPHILDGINYDYWKDKMLSFLKSTDNKTLKGVVKGWKHLVITFQDGTTSLKPKADWSKDENGEALRNEKSLNFIFNGVDKNMFRLINSCVEAKSAWEISRLLMKAHLKCVCQG